MPGQVGSSLHVYDEAVAGHYAAYRPPLHAPILENALGDARFVSGLDVGCGTGHSTAALALRTETVIGIDSSQSMIASAPNGPGTEFRQGEAASLPVPDCAFDIVTYAGVLPYLDKQLTVRELNRVCAPKAKIVIYDFHVEMAAFKGLFDLDAGPSNSAYDHASCLEGEKGVSTLNRSSCRLTFSVEPQDVAYLLLSSDKRLEALAKVFQTHDPFDAVCKRLSETNMGSEVEAVVFSAVHELNG